MPLLLPLPPLADISMIAEYFAMMPYFAAAAAYYVATL